MSLWMQGNQILGHDIQRGMKPDPAKVDALKYISPPSNKDDCISFLCMMQSNADFTENFAQRATQL